ncbi:MAG: rod shape-determining protein MreD [Oscillospiraceae bacterium]|jgi:rod shape-determining protein MreD|nr:rod shape-determining protein MreD [Oscillospiraceae bacterium]
MNKKQTTFRCIIYIIEAVFLHVISQIPHFLPTVVGHKPNLLLALLITIVLFESNRICAIFGLVCGFLIDTNLDVFVGFHAILLCILSYVFGAIYNSYLQRNFISYFVVSMLFISIFYHAQFLFLYVFAGYGDVYYAYVFHYISCMLYCWLFSQIFYFFNSVLNSKLRKNYLSF